MSFGRPYILKTSGCIHDGWLVLKPDYKRIDQDFLYYVLSSPTTFAQFDAAAAGSTVRNLNIGLVEKVRIPLPPLEEQKRIVAVLDQAFAALDRARALAEANLADGEALHPGFVTSLVSKHGSDWPISRLGEIYDVRDGTHDSPRYQETGRALITSKNLGRFGLNFNKVKFISNEDYVSISKRSAVDKGDVLFAMIGTIGNPVVVDVEPDFAIKNVALFKMQNGRSGVRFSTILRPPCSSGCGPVTSRSLVNLQLPLFPVPVIGSQATLSEVKPRSLPTLSHRHGEGTGREASTRYFNCVHLFAD